MTLQRYRIEIEQDWTDSLNQEYCRIHPVLDPNGGKWVRVEDVVEFLKELGIDSVKHGLF